MKGKLRGVSFWYSGLKMAETCDVLLAVSESDMSHDVFFPCYDEGTQACAHHEGCGTRLELESNVVFKLPVLSSTSSPTLGIEKTTTRFPGLPPTRPRPCSFHKMRGSAYFRHVGYSELAIAIVMPSISFSSESDEFKMNWCSFQSSERREELQCHDEEDTAEKRVTKTVKILRVIDRGKIEARIAPSCAHVQMQRHPEFHLDCAYMGRATEDRESWMCGFSKGQWLIVRDKERENVQRCVNVDKLVDETITSSVQALTVAESGQEVKFDQEVSITDVKFTSQGKSCGELRSAGRSSTENSLVEKSVREMQINSLMVHGITSDPGCARPHVIRSQPSVPDVTTACGRRKRKSCRKALVNLDELVMLMTIDKPEHQPYASTIMLDLVDMSHEVVVGMIVPGEQRDGATVREELQTLADIAEGELVNPACVASVRSTGKVMELREDNVRWFRITRGVELAKCGAASGDEVSRPHGKAPGIACKG